MLVHAGRGIPALGRDALVLAERFERARIILAHAAISDLSWLWAHLREHPNLLVDTSDGAEMLALARLAATVAPDAPQAEMCAAILALLDQHRAHVAELSCSDGEPRFPGIHLVVIAAGLARTPEVPVPAPA